MSKKKILFITGEFLPYTQSVGGVIRLVSFIRTLNKFDITILCSKGKYFGYFGFEKYLKNVKTIFVNSHGNKLINNENIILRILRTLFSNIFYLFAFDSKFILVNSYKLKLKNILNNSKPDCIILSGPPFSLFKLALFIKSYDKKIKVIIDYRDGWTQRIKSSKLYIIKKFLEKFEKKIILSSDAIYSATSKINKDINNLIKKKKSILLTNGFFQTAKNKIKPKKKSNKIKIGYFGLISDSNYSYRDINVIYRSIKNIKNCKFSFYGNSKINNKKIKNFRLFNFLKNLSYFDALDKMKSFDYLLILHTEKSTSSEVITGKFYEYINSGVPIIMISNGTTEAGRLIVKHNLGLVLDYSKQSIEKFFKELNIRKFKVKRKSTLSSFSRKEQNKKLLRLINKWTKN